MVDGPQKFKEFMLQLKQHTDHQQLQEIRLIMRAELQQWVFEVKASPLDTIQFMNPITATRFTKCLVQYDSVMSS